MKAVLINRAVPGSGKTTFAKNIFAAVSIAGLTVAVHSTDEYFMRNGRYVFDVSKLGEYHRRNLAAFKESLAKGVDLVVVDNTNLHPWETEPYTTAARAAGYRIILMNFMPREFEKHMEAQKVTPEKPDAHEVPESSMREHIADFNNYNELLDKNAVPDPARHFNYRWDDYLQDVVRVPTPVKPFDYDVLIQVTPTPATPSRTRSKKRSLTSSIDNQGSTHPYILQIILSDAKSICIHRAYFQQQKSMYIFPQKLFCILKLRKKLLGRTATMMCRVPHITE